MALEYVAEFLLTTSAGLHAYAFKQIMDNKLRLQALENEVGIDADARVHE